MGLSAVLVDFSLKFYSTLFGPVPFFFCKKLIRCIQFRVPCFLELGYISNLMFFSGRSFCPGYILFITHPIFHGLTAWILHDLIMAFWFFLVSNSWYDTDPLLHESNSLSMAATLLRISLALSLILVEQVIISLLKRRL